MTSYFSLFENIVRRSKNYGEIVNFDSNTSHPFDERNIHTEIANVSMKLFDDGHYTQATFEAFKLIELTVKNVSGIQKSGEKLMMDAFSKNGVIQLNNLSSISENDEQEGFRFIFSGAITGIRNPRAHDIRKDPIELCLDHLSVASALLRVLDSRKAPK